MDVFRAAIFAKLNGDRELTSLLSTTTSIYHRRAPLNAAFPFVIFTKQSGVSVWTFAGNAIADQVWLFKGIDRAASASKAEAIDQRLGEILTDPVVDLSRGNLLFLRRESDVDYEEDTDPDLVVHHVGGLYRTVIDRS